MATGLTKSQVENLIEFVGLHFIDSIRQDTEIDNIDYVVDTMDALIKLRSTLEVLKLKNKSKTECPYADLMTDPKEKHDGY